MSLSIEDFGRLLAAKRRGRGVRAAALEAEVTPSTFSRVENGHTVPAIETLEKMARALEVPMYRLFHAGEVPAGLSKLKPPKDNEFGSKGSEADYFSKLRRLLAKMELGDQKLLLHMAQKVARD